MRDNDRGCGMRDNKPKEGGGGEGMQTGAYILSHDCGAMAQEMHVSRRKAGAFLAGKRSSASGSFAARQLWLEARWGIAHCVPHHLAGATRMPGGGHANDKMAQLCQTKGRAQG